MAHDPNFRYGMKSPYGPHNPPPPPPGSPPRDAAGEARLQQLSAPSPELVQTPALSERSDYWHLDEGVRAVSRHEADSRKPQHSQNYSRRDGRDRSRSPALERGLKREGSFYCENSHYRERSSYSRTSNGAVQQNDPTAAQERRYTPGHTYIDRRNDIEDEVDWDDEDLEDVKSVLSTAVLESDTNRMHNHPIASHEHQHMDRPIQSRPNRSARAVYEIDHYSPPRQPTVLDYSMPLAQTDLASRASGSVQNQTPVPSTVYNLRDYDGQIVVQNNNRPRKERFFNGNGKVKPKLYGSTQDKDLGLCFTTFCTKFFCEMGPNCPWRHHPLTKSERKWILSAGGDLGRKFMNNVDMWWSCPEIPVPGACMRDKA